MTKPDWEIALFSDPTFKAENWGGAFTHLGPAGIQIREAAQARPHLEITELAGQSNMVGYGQSECRELPEKAVSTDLRHDPVPTQYPGFSGSWTRGI